MVTLKLVDGHSKIADELRTRKRSGCTSRGCMGRNRWKNGKSPLEVARINTADLDWARFSQTRNRFS